MFVLGKDPGDAHINVGQFKKNYYLFPAAFFTSVWLLTYMKDECTTQHHFSGIIPEIQENISAKI